MYRIARHPKQLPTLLSAACDGGACRVLGCSDAPVEVRLWNLSSRKCLRTYAAHKGFVRGLVVSPISDNFVTVGDDRMVKLWSLEDDSSNPKVPLFRGSSRRDAAQPVSTALAKDAFSDVDHHRNQALFATSGSSVEIWDHARSREQRRRPGTSRSVGRSRFPLMRGEQNRFSP